MDIKAASTGHCGNRHETGLLRPVRIIGALSALAFALPMLGCVASSISESSDSLSGSISSSSKSFTSSSGESKESYLRDIKQFTAAYSRSNSDMKGLTRGLAIISAQYGVTDWEAYNATYLGIGEGFAKAAVSQQQVDLYLTQLAKGDPLKTAAIQQGFSQGH